MTKYHLGSDRGGASDEACLEKIKETLESSGHEVNYLRINPNLETDLTREVKDGEIGLYGVNGFCIGTMVSINEMAKKKNIQLIAFTMESGKGTGPNDYLEEPNFSTKKVGMAHDDTFSSAETRAKYGGSKYTPKEVIDQLSNVSFVPWQGSCEKQAEGIMNGPSGSSSNNTSSDGEDSVMSGWESLCDLLKPLDGLATMVQRGDTVIIRKIEVPGEVSGDSTNLIKSKINEDEETNTEDNTSEMEENIAKTNNVGEEETNTETTLVGARGLLENPTLVTNQLFAYEGLNIVSDSVTISDYSPEIYNTIKVKWGESFENEFTLSFDRHKKLFGERMKEVEAKKKITKYTLSDDSKNDDSKNESSEK